MKSAARIAVGLSLLVVGRLTMLLATYRPSAVDKCLSPAVRGEKEMREDDLDPDVKAATDAMLLAANLLLSHSEFVEDTEMANYYIDTAHWMRDRANEMVPEPDDWPEKVVPLDAYRKRMH